MRKYASNCVTRLMETYMSKHLISHNTPDRMYDEGTSDMFPLSNKFYNEFKSKFKDIIENASFDTEEKINRIISGINLFLFDNEYNTSWTPSEDNDFKNELYELLTTEDRLINCENCRSLMGRCRIFD